MTLLLPALRVVDAYTQSTIAVFQFKFKVFFFFSNILIVNLAYQAEKYTYTNCDVK